MASPFIVNRKQTNELYRRLLVASGIPADRVQEVIDKMYPIGCGDALIELNLRGLAATNRDVYMFANHPENGVRRAGKTHFLWSTINVDGLAEILEGRDKLTYSAFERRDDRTPVADCLGRLSIQCEPLLKEKLHHDGLLPATN